MISTSKEMDHYVDGALCLKWINIKEILSIVSRRCGVQSTMG